MGILVFAQDDFIKPIKLIPVHRLSLVPLARRVGSHEHLFKLIVDKEELTLGAPDKD